MYILAYIHRGYSIGKDGESVLEWKQSGGEDSKGVFDRGR